MNYMPTNKILHSRSLIALALILSGCVSIPPETHSLALRDAEQTARLDSSLKLSPSNWPSADWWTQYKDPQLNALIQRALTGTPDLDIAKARVRQAYASIEHAEANSGAQLGANTSLSRELESKNGMFPPPYGGSWLTNGRTTLDFSYEFDWWNKHHTTLEATIGEVRAAEAEHASAQLVLTTSVAQTYFTYQTESARLALSEKSVAHYKHLLKLNQLRLQHGLDPITNQQQTQGNLATEHLNKAIIETNVQLAKSQLQALLGISANELPSLKTVELPVSEATLPSQLGLDLVAHRPDLQAARWKVEASAHRIEAAKAEFYPNINLTAFLGFTSLTLDKLLDAGSQIRGIAPAIHIPIFDSGRLKANLGISRANAELAIAQYNQTLVNAVKDVTDQALTLQGLARQQQALNESLQAAKNTQNTVALQAKHGLIDDSVLIQTQLKVLTQHDAMLQLSNRRLSSQIHLIRALGGGYTSSGDHHG